MCFIYRVSTFFLQSGRKLRASLVLARDPRVLGLFIGFLVHTLYDEESIPRVVQEIWKGIFGGV